MASLLDDVPRPAVSFALAYLRGEPLFEFSELMCSRTQSGKGRLWPNQQAVLGELYAREREAIEAGDTAKIQKGVRWRVPHDASPSLRASRSRTLFQLEARGFLVRLTEDGDPVLGQADKTAYVLFTEDGRQTGRWAARQITPCPPASGQWMEERRTQYGGANDPDEHETEDGKDQRVTAAEVARGV